MQPRKWGNEYRTTVVCIDSYERRVPEGRFYNQYYPDGVRFYGAIDFLRKMENILDLMRFPQSFSRVRTFADVPVMEQQAPDGSKSHEGELATLAVRVLFRQHASWQGAQLWLEKNTRQSFRSVLELITLMDSALRAEKN